MGVMTHGTDSQAAPHASSCHVEQKSFCFEQLLVGWMAGRSPERVAADLLVTPTTVRNWLGTGAKLTTPRVPLRPHVARVFGITEDHLDRAIAATVRRRNGPGPDSVTTATTRVERAPEAQS